MALSDSYCEGFLVQLNHKTTATVLNPKLTVIRHSNYSHNYHSRIGGITIVAMIPIAATFMMDTVLTVIVIATMPVPTVMTVGLICETIYPSVTRIMGMTGGSKLLLGQYIQLTTKNITIRFPFNSPSIIEVLIHTIHHTDTVREPSPT